MRIQSWSLAIPSLVVVAPLFASGCASCERRVENPPTTEVVTPPPAPPEPARYEVHEWGLLRGNLADRVVLSGPRRAPTPIPIAKPVLYFHRDGEAALSVDVEVALASGTMVEHWPLVPGATGASLAWRGVTITEGTCAGSRYPTLAEPPCNTLVGADGCEAVELGTIETHDSDCLSYGGASWNHLFYRGELTTPPSFPLAVAPLPSDRYRITVEHAITGAMVRVRGTSAGVIAAPAVGASVELDVPTGSLVEGADGLARALGEAGLSADEVAAFRRAWDSTLFPEATAAAGELVVTATPMAGGLLRPRTRDALLYVLSQEDAARLASLTFTPSPTRVARAMVVWLELSRAMPAYEPPY